MTTTSDDTRRTLDLLAQGKITVDEAERLLKAFASAHSSTDSQPADGASGEKPPARWVRINVHKPGNDQPKEKEASMRMAIVASVVIVSAVSIAAQTSSTSTSQTSTPSSAQTMTLTGCVGGGSNAQPFTLSSAMVIPNTAGPAASAAASPGQP